jgi:amino acid transporter
VASPIVRPKSRGSFTLWFAVAAPPLLWITQLGVGGELPEVACSPGYEPNNMLGVSIRDFLVAVTVVLVLPVVAAAVMSFLNLRALRAIDNRNDREERGYFMALLGFVASSYFLVIMVVSAIAIFYLALCQR